jgi:tRNA pseudouridine55 synthase
MSDPVDGVLVVDKPAGMTSHDVVATVRRRLPRGTKVGHTGTLDPFATGVLPVVLGKATRLSQFLTAGRKQYVADVAFGTATDSCDRTGTVIETAPPRACDTLGPDALRDALATFLGTHHQVPPAHSAKKVEGERAYARARRGDVVELAPVPVTAHALELVSWDASRGVAIVRLDTTAGYYVRSFARDLGQRLGVPAHLEALRRSLSGSFTLADARSLGDVAQAGLEQIVAWRVPMGALLPHWPALCLDASQEDAVRHGQPFAGTAPDAALHQAPEARIRLLDAAGDLVGLARAAAHAPHLLHADIVLR